MKEMAMSKKYTKGSVYCFTCTHNVEADLIVAGAQDAGQVGPEVRSVFVLARRGVRGGSLPGGLTRSLQMDYSSGRLCDANQLRRKKVSFQERFWNAPKSLRSLSG